VKGNLDLPLRADLRGRRPYGAPQVPGALRMNTNENPYPPPTALVAELAAEVAAAAAAANRYPDSGAVELRADLAGYLGAGLGVDQVWAGNGSNEVIQHVLQAFGGPGRTALGFVPSFSMHPIVAAGTGTRWVAEPRRADFGLDPDLVTRALARHRPDVVFLTDPNNPTGGAAGPGVLEAVLEAAPGMVVVDEAYAEFSAAPSAVDLVAAGTAPALIVARTMSKAFAMAGTRMGYLAAAPEVVAALQLVRLPYHLSSLTQVAARVALRYTDALLATVATLVADRERLAVELRARGITVADSQANFLLFSVPGEPDSAGLWQRILDRGVLVRDVGLPGWLRVTVSTPGDNATFLAALDGARGAR
jgi:histidinol-phosphate aminotransferase